MSHIHKSREELQTAQTQTPPWIGFRHEDKKEDSAEFIVSEAGMQPVRRIITARRRLLLYLALIVALPVFLGTFLKIALPLWAFALGGMIQLAMIAKGRDAWDDGVWNWVLSAAIIISLCWLDYHFFKHDVIFAIALGIIAFIYGALVRQVTVRKIIPLLVLLAAVHGFDKGIMPSVYILIFLGSVWAAIWGLILPHIPRPEEIPGVEEKIWNPFYGLRLGAGVALGIIIEQLFFDTNTSLGAIAAACIIMPERKNSPLWLISGALGAILGALPVLALLKIPLSLPVTGAIAAILLFLTFLASQRFTLLFAMAQAACMTMLLSMAVPGINLSVLPIFLMGVALGIVALIIPTREN